MCIRDSGKAVWYRGSRLIETASGTYETARWYHTAYVRIGTTLKCYIDGILKDTATDNGNYSELTSSIGALDGGGEFSEVTLDGVRISNTARYSANFTPSTTRPTSDSNTIFLLNAPISAKAASEAYVPTLSDSSANATSLTVTGTFATQTTTGFAPSNADGSETSQVRANPTYGQSIVKYTGSGSAATLGHGLSAAPEWIFVKNRGVNDPWSVYYGDNTDYMVLDTTAATVDNANRWNDTSPTSSVFTVNTDHSVNADGENYIAYCWHSVANYTKIGTYTGDATTDGSLSVAVGFKPAFVIIKRTDGTNGWLMIDNTRNSSNPVNHYHYANTNDAEADGSICNFTSTGFDLLTNLADVNADGGTYTYMAHIDKREYAYWLDDSGNNNDWTSNGLTESDISVDSPTNNFATLNPLNHFVTNKPSQAEGNLKTICGSVNTGSKHCIAATMAMTSGKWYFEVLIGSLANSHFSHIGVANSDVKEFSELLSTVANSGNVPWDNDFGWGYDAYNGKKEHDNTQSTYGSQASLGDIIGVAVDMDNGKIWFADNNTYIASGDPAAGSNAAYTNLAGTVVPVVSTQDGSTAFVTMNFGQDSSFAGGKTAQGNLDGNGIGDFFYAPPSGFLALCSKNLPAPSITPTSAFKALLYTGTGSNQAVSGVGFQPDFLWVKNTATAGNNLLFDVVRGGDGTNLEGLRTDRETVASTQSDEMRSLDSDGFTTDTGEDTNGDGHSIISFNWKAGSGNTAFSESGDNPAGTHNANVAAGFSIVSYVGTGAVGTVAHGLGAAPEMMWVKNRDVNDSWAIYYGDNTDYLKLDLTTATADDAAWWNDTSPTSSVFTVATDHSVNADAENYIAYCWRSVDGFSKVGIYTGNGNADGAFIYLGFRPAWVFIKRINNGDQQSPMYTSAIDTSNPAISSIKTEDSVAIQTNQGFLDLLSNGFKAINAEGSTNTNGGTYLFMAFAEQPFQNSNAR